MVQPITHFLENTPGPYYKVVQITSLSPKCPLFLPDTQSRPSFEGKYLQYSIAKNNARIRLICNWQWRRLGAEFGGRTIFSRT